MLRPAVEPLSTPVTKQEALTYLINQKMVIGTQLDWTLTCAAKATTEAEKTEERQRAKELLREKAIIQFLVDSVQADPKVTSRGKK